MKESTILQMFYGNEGNYESMKMPPSDKKLFKKLIVAEQKFLDSIKNLEEIRKLYENFDSLLQKLHIQENETFYVYGFKFALRLSAEAFTNNCSGSISRRNSCS